MMKRFLLLTMCLAALSGSALAYDVNKGCCSGPVVDTSDSKSCSPAAKSLFQQRTAAVRASKLLDQADELYIAAHAIDGDVRAVGRRVSWLEDKVKAGKCRKG